MLFWSGCWCELQLHLAIQKGRLLGNFGPFCQVLCPYMLTGGGQIGAFFCAFLFDTFDTADSNSAREISGFRVVGRWGKREGLPLVLHSAEVWRG